MSHLSHFRKDLLQNVKTDSELAQTIISHPDLGELMTRFLFPRGMQQLNGNRTCEMIQHVAWVGFVDDYKRSICLLHARFDFPHHPRELSNMRPTKRRSSRSFNVTAVGILVRNQTTILDDALYECARERFLWVLRQWAPTCLYDNIHRLEGMEQQREYSATPTFQSAVDRRGYSFSNSWTLMFIRIGRRASRNTLYSTKGRSLVAGPLIT